METIFQDLVGMDGVHGLVLLSREGKVLYEALDDDKFLPEKNSLSWKMIVESFEGMEEIDLIYERGRYYMRRAEDTFLFVSMSAEESISMVKLNSDIVISNFKKAAAGGKGLKRFFRF